MDINREYRSKKVIRTVISIMLVMAFVPGIFIDLYGVLSNNPLNSFDYTELLINFEGGYVRRGLLGEGIYILYKSVSLDLIGLLTGLCIATFGGILWWFFKMFKRRGYCWWLLLSPIFLGVTVNIIRKDYMLYLILIEIVYLLSRKKESVSKIFVACGLMITGLLLHEAFIFLGYPIYALILLNNKRLNLGLKSVLIILPVALFITQCHFKGTEECGSAIVDSWNNVLPGEELSYQRNNSIGALGWETGETMIWHVKNNVNVNGGCLGAIWIPLFMIAVFYMLTNFLWAFRRTSEEEADKERRALSILCVVSGVSLLPMFTVLSCDMVRVFQYWAVATFVPFLLMPRDKVIALFPIRLVERVNRFNGFLRRIVRPTKGLLVAMLLLIGMNYWLTFSVDACFEHSVIGKLGSYLNDLIIMIF